MVKPPPQQTASHKHRIICADGDEPIAEALAGQLREWGYEAEAATHERDVLAALADADLLLIDLDAATDGWAIVHAAREKQPDLPIVFMSGSPKPDEPLDRAVFLSKPFDTDQVRASVRALLGETAAEGRAASDYADSA